MAIDRITASSMKDFSEKFDIKDIESATIFEHFVNYVILEKELEDRVDFEFLRDINIGINGTIGLDGFCILLNGVYINSDENLLSMLEQRNKPRADVFFIQSKTTNSFNVSDIGLFGDSVEDFISEKRRFNWSENALSSINLLEKLFENAHLLQDNPNCYMFYCTLGNFNNDKNVNSKRDLIIKRIKDQKVFSSVNFSYKDSNEINKDYKNIGKKISKTFNFEKRQTIPEIDGVDESYIGIISVKDVINLIGENGNLISSVFYDNVRDYQGDNNVNKEIRESIYDDKLKFAFSILNNGITIVAEECNQTRDKFNIVGYQIINGLQTSRVLWSEQDRITDDMYIPIKLIVTKDEYVISKVIRSTNRQTAIKDEDLIAYSDFQKRIEDFFLSIDEKDRLYYERRSKQYNDTDIKSKYIVDKTTLIKSIGSFYFMKPNLATRYFGKLFEEFKKQIFLDSHVIDSYYAAVLTYKRIENLFSNNKIDKKYWKIRYFILMMVRLEYGIEKLPFQGKKVEKLCQSFIKILNSENDFERIIDSILNKLQSIPNIDYTNNELSKSAHFIDECKSLYLKNS